MTIISYQLFFVGFFDIYYVYIKILNYSSFGLIKPHIENFSKPPRVMIYSLAISTMSANVSVSLLPSAYTNVTLSSPIEHMAVTFRVPRQSGDGYNAGGYSVIGYCRQSSTFSLSVKSLNRRHHQCPLSF